MIYAAGVDIGSVFSKITIMSSEFKVNHIMYSGQNYKSTADQVMKKALAKVNLSPNDITYVVATGYGASNVSFAHEIITEVSCQAKGVSYLFPSVRTAIDIGGQFTRVFKLDDRGRAIAFVLSEKCASGSGRFLQVIARILQIDFMEIGPHSLKSQEMVDFNTGCAVFAESEAISRITEGTSKEDILAGIHRAMAAKTVNLVERIGLTTDCALLGGGAKDIGLVKSIEDTMKLSILVPEEPQSVASLGAALIAGEKASLPELVNLKESNHWGYR